MEVAGLVVGIAGLAAVFETGCTIWLTISHASKYGRSVANALSKLEMEFFKFQAWWIVLDRLVADPRNRARRDGPAPMPSSKLLKELQRSAEHPVTNAAQNIVRLLGELQDILSNNGALDTAAQVRTGHEPLPASDDKPVSSLLARAEGAKTRHAALAKKLRKSTPFFTRVIHGAKPWDGADEEKIEKILQDINYWNQSLYDILPFNIRESVLAHGMAGYLLDSEEDVLNLSEVDKGKAQTAVAVECARLVELRKRVKLSPGQNGTQNLLSALDDMRKTKGFAGKLPREVDMQHPFSVLKYTTNGDGEITLKTCEVILFDITDLVFQIKPTCLSSGIRSHRFTLDLIPESWRRTE